MLKKIGLGIGLLSATLVTFADNPNTLTETVTTRFFLNQASTQRHPTAFHCTVKLISQRKPPCGSDGNCQKVQVVMMNHGQNILGFAGNKQDGLQSLGHGRLALTGTNLNSYYFKAYHDSSAGYKEQPGYVDVIVAWPNARVYCATGVGYKQPLELRGSQTYVNREKIPGHYG
ncbi:hypothetical protein [Piscirickettsia litoralis]|uniref:Secreted protein n=1 Tax=Piscirickettsia litoralis TaxID=1891921 RepID=A0ABX3A4C1_9GAMM|nr:hypothetical protein [Piscirickettsia litoralis]ODN42280.1 hypothetical protein BGC07_04185 [Piscirickettsia litoralis]